VFALAQLPVSFWVLLQVPLVSTELSNVEPLPLPLLLYAKEFQDIGTMLQPHNANTAISIVKNAQPPLHAHKTLLP